MTLGTLSVGNAADIAMLPLESEEFPYVECNGATMPGTQRLRCEMTKPGGDVIHNPSGDGTGT